MVPVHGRKVSCVLTTTPSPVSPHLLKTSSPFVPCDYYKVTSSTPPPFFLYLFLSFPLSDKILLPVLLLHIQFRLHLFFSLAMEVSEDIMPQNSYDEHLHGVAKGKRTKRQRTHRLSSATATVASSNSLVEVSGSSMEEEDEDLANCLILLAQGRALDTSSHRDGVKPMEAAASGDHGNNYVYRCRTCNKCFSSFQALGGHRTGHKRPKTPAPATMAAIERNKEADHEYDLKISVATAANPETRSSSSSAALSGTAITAGGKPRSHECSICGLEFSSGQALGGHMRRHRLTVVPVYSQEPKKEKNVFDLDLNLPAPSEDEPESSSSATTFPITGKQALHLPSLVDCHY